MPYDRAGNDLILDYSAGAVPPLTGAWVGRADKLLRARSLRD
jgi:hypothetical protein